MSIPLIVLPFVHGEAMDKRIDTTTKQQSSLPASRIRHPDGCSLIDAR